MCGIVGYLGTQQAQGILLDCLGRLEYRGYDSAGIAVIAGGKLGRQRSKGKSADLRAQLEKTPLPGQLGIAHTRWATHGRPSDHNSHPHTDCSGALAIVHNGIVENHIELKAELTLKGHRFQSETDSEVIAHLIEDNLSRDLDGGLETAVRNALTVIQGTYALAVISQQEADKIIVARSGGPALVIGHSPEGLFISSDITAILNYTRDIQILEDDEIALINRDGATITLLNGDAVSRDKVQVVWEQSAVEKNGFAHFMLKEIHEQPGAVMDTVRGQTLLSGGGVSFPHAPWLETEEFALTQRISMVACGSSWHAALVGKSIIESLCGTPVDVEIASEYRYRARTDYPDRLVIGISQSGETADTLGALQTAKREGARILALCNIVGSSMSREADEVIYTHAGPEIGVAATKTFICQLTALVLFAISLAQAKGKMSASSADQLIQELMALPELMERVLSQDEQLAQLAQLFGDHGHALYLGRGTLLPLAMEGALKLKEISYIHAEAYPAGELKHGPIALIDKDLPVVIIATEGQLYEKILSATQEVMARDGRVIAMATEGDQKIGAIVEHVFYLPRTSALLMPILMALPMQLLAYHAAVQRGCDVDKPRNLAKSVTVD
jgi:glucosamine--fructose-6-phosphate aminotransferase (isomerizing)